jgi:transcriptional regulator
VYLPPQFRQDDPDEIRAFVRGARLATVFTSGPNGPRASHVPIDYDEDPAPLGTLRFHLARANEQWCDLAAGDIALVAFLGADDAYVSPSFYATKAETGKVVPTWNYVAVHAYGRARTSDDPSELYDLVRSLTDRRETGRDEPWRVDDAPESFVAAQLRGIVAVTIPIDRFDAKWKLSQNRSDADVAGVVSGLRASPHACERAAAERVAERSKRA